MQKPEKCGEVLEKDPHVSRMMKIQLKCYVHYLLVLFSLKTIETEPKTLLHFKECRLCSSVSHSLTLGVIDVATDPEYHPYVTLGKM